MTKRLVGWNGVDPGRLDSAAVDFGDDSLSAHGSSTTPEYTLSYALTTGSHWVTTTLSVTVHGERSLLLWRTDDGWSARWDGDGTAGFALPDLRAAKDCDLGLCPLTNTMPVLRHDLLGAARNGGGTAVDFTMAWVSVPDLEVHVSSQRYTAEKALDGGGALVRFDSEGFTADIEFDADGLVRNYPGIAVAASN